jgi:hypothetical protein
MPLSLSSLDDDTLYTDDEAGPLLGKSKRFLQRKRAGRRLGFFLHGKTPVSTGKQLKALVLDTEVRPIRRRG